MRAGYEETYNVGNNWLAVVVYELCNTERSEFTIQTPRRSVRLIALIMPIFLFAYVSQINRNLDLFHSQGMQFPE